MPAAPDAPLPRRAWLVLAGCLVCQLGPGLFYATQALSADVIADLGWTRTRWSSAMAPMLFVSSLGQAVVGAACARVGVRPVLVTGVVALAGTFALLGTLGSLAGFYAAMLLLAVGSTCCGDVVVGSVVTRWFERGRGPALGLALVGSNLGAVVSVHAIATLGAGGSWRQAALWVGAAAVAVILPAALFAVRYPRAGELTRAAPAEGGAPGTVAGATPSEALRSFSFWALLLVVFTYAFMQLGLINHLILYLVDLGYDRGEAAGALELTVAAGILAKLGAGAITTRMAPRTALFLNTTLLAAGIALLPFAGDATALALFGLCFGVSTAARDVLFPLVVADTFGTRHFPQIFGLLMAAFFPGGALGPVALAAVHEATGHYAPAFGAAFALVTVTALAILLLPRTRTLST